jgi:hypothetical protein
MSRYLGLEMGRAKPAKVGLGCNAKFWAGELNGALDQQWIAPKTSLSVA